MTWILPRQPEATDYGFVYKVTNLKTGEFYIGKKALKHKRKVKIGKQEKATTKTRKTFKVVHKDSGWEDYYGSGERLKMDIKKLGKECFSREIIMFAHSKQALTYWETAYQFMYEVLLKETYNDNILGKFYRKTLKKPDDKI